MKKILKTEYKSKTISIAQDFFYNVSCGFFEWVLVLLFSFFVGKHFIIEIPRTVLLLAT